MMKMPQYQEKLENECVVTYGVSGWSDYFFASIPPGYPIENLKRLCQGRIPLEMQITHPLNEKLKFIRIYRFEKELILEGMEEHQKEACDLDSQSEASDLST